MAHLDSEAQAVGSGLRTHDTGCQPTEDTKTPGEPRLEDLITPGTHPWDHRALFIARYESA